MAWYGLNLLWLALKMEKRATDKGVGQFLEAEEAKERDSALEPPEVQPCPDFSPLRTFLDF